MSENESFVPLGYINFIMSIPESQTLKKSSTHSFALPSIGRNKIKLPTHYKTSASNQKTRQHNSLFLDKIKDLTKDAPYDQMQTSSITEQQKQLKNIIRQFNQETYHILGRYIDKASDRKAMATSRTTEMRKSSTGRGHSSSMVGEVQEKEIANSMTSLEICKRQLQALEKKSENLKYVTTEEFSKKIETTKEQIEEQRNAIKQILKGNTLRGLSIKRQDNTDRHEVSALEYEKYILEKKKQRLVRDTSYVKEEQDKLNQRSNEADKKMQDMAEEFQKIDKEEKQRKEASQRRQKFQQMKKDLALKKQKKQMMSGRKSSTNQAEKHQEQSLGLESGKKGQKLSEANKQKPAAANKYQLQYFKLLKQLEEVVIKNQNSQTQLYAASERVEDSKKQILAYEHKLSMLRKNGKQKSPIQQEQQKQLNDNDKNKSPGSVEKKGLIASIFG